MSVPPAMIACASAVVELTVYLRVSAPAGTYDQHNLRAMFSLDLVQLAWVTIEAIGSD